MIFALNLFYAFAMIYSFKCCIFAALKRRMKHIIIAALLFAAASLQAQNHKTENVVLVTFDGYRWQDLFKGAEKKLLLDKKQVQDTAKLKAQYWAANIPDRRARLMPFMWNTIAKQGLIIGNRNLQSYMRLTNIYKFSFPGYNEIFSGYPDIRVNSNNYGDNPNMNIFDFLAAQKEFENKIAAFATWDAFPKIINTHRNKVPVFINFKTAGVSYDAWQTTCPATEPWAMTDTMTYHFAKEYIHRNHPRFAFIGFDETDDYAHQGKYDAYLNTANMLDRFMQDLWTMLQSDPVYKDKTTLIITCDHGRGHAGKKFWHHHGPFVRDSHQIWLAAIGPDTPALVELSKSKPYTQKQIAATIAQLFGKEYKEDHSSGQPIDILSGGGK
jgi:hypothetical protein